MNVKVDLWILASEKRAFEYIKTLWCSNDLLKSNGGWVSDNNISWEIGTNMLQIGYL